MITTTEFKELLTEIGNEKREELSYLTLPEETRNTIR
jgi:hypothetical protein